MWRVIIIVTIIIIIISASCGLSITAFDCLPELVGKVTGH